VNWKECEKVVIIHIGWAGEDHGNLGITVAPEIVTQPFLCTSQKGINNYDSEIHKLI
jgi:hypothetical protein